MWAVFALIAVALAFYVLERTPMELTSLGMIAALLIFFDLFPVTNADGVAVLTPTRILEGFANPALITVLALLVMGQGIIRTGLLERGAARFLEWSAGHLRPWGAVGGALAAVAAISAYLNNTPVVVIFIPIMRVLAGRFGQSVSKIMIPLSYTAILGGMTTLIGSSTNLLVNGALIEMNVTPFGFFDFVIPGLVLASSGFLYVIVIVPRLLPDRASMADSIVDRDGKHFVAQITVTADSELIGKGAPGGHFSGLPEKTLRLVQRGERAILPPFEDYTVRSGDVLVVSATRKALGDFLADGQGQLHPDLEQGDDAPGQVTSIGRWQEGEQALAEVMVAPASRMAGQTLPQIGFRYKTQCIVLGIQRRQRMIRQRITDIRLDPGDVLLVQGQPEDIRALGRLPDVVLIEGSAGELPALEHAKRAGLIFIGVVALAASGTVPIVVTAVAGAVAMVATGVLNVRQAFRAIDSKIVTAIAAAIAMSVSLLETGGAAFLANGIVGIFGAASPAVVLSTLFLLVAVATNIISNNAVAVLFTPIAVDLALALGIEPHVFAVTVLFAANCSFASPLGYQTNLLVMGPGHYKFTDFARAGAPLILLLWGVFSVFAPWYYGI
ncbi:MAG: SLC13 family permease [Proteobacteria bacterium]|nr:SLC13 family permease [Pseudomonadota bacterium]